MAPGKTKRAKNCAGATMNKPMQKSAAPRGIMRGLIRMDVVEVVTGEVA